MWNGVAVFEGYTLFKMWKPAHSDRYKPKGEVKSKELLKETRSVYARELAFPEKIEIVRVFYKGELEDTAYLKWRNKPWAEARMQQSDLKVESTPVVFDFKGDLIDPYSVTLSGYMAFARIADSLPKEYRPSNWPP